MDLVILALALLIALPAAARACTTVVIGREVSPTGHVIVGHNEDDGGRLVNRHGCVPAADHAPGETLPAEDGHAVIPQAAHTHGFYWSEMKGAAGGMSTADSFYNDQGVLIVSNSCVDSKEDPEDASRLSEGGIGFNLRRVMAERATSARHAVEIGVEMLERYGYVSSGRSYTCADADEAWMLQVVSGRRYAACRVGDREAAFIPNYYTIHEINFDDRDNFIVSPDLVEYAQKKGWYDPAQGAFDFARAYQAEKDWMGPGNTYRSAAGYSILTRSPFWREDRYPFAVVPKRPVAVEQVMEILRCYYEGSFLDPAWARMQFPGARRTTRRSAASARARPWNRPSPSSAIGIVPRPRRCGCAQDAQANCPICPSTRSAACPPRWTRWETKRRRFWPFTAAPTRRSRHGATTAGKSCATSRTSSNWSSSSITTSTSAGCGATKTPSREAKANCRRAPRRSTTERAP